MNMSIENNMLRLTISVRSVSWFIDFLLLSISSRFNLPVSKQNNYDEKGDHCVISGVVRPCVPGAKLLNCTVLSEK